MLRQMLWSATRNTLPSPMFRSAWLAPAIPDWAYTSSDTEPLALAVTA
jgi:hypothetical protein